MERMCVMAHIVTCLYCKKQFDRDKLAFHQVSARRYAHIECYNVAETKKNQEERDKQALEEYLKSLFGEAFINVKTNKQIKEYREQYGYTYSGIRKALVYFYDVKGNDKNKANGGIGIVPYVYKEAYNYYYALWEAKQKNEGKKIEDYVPAVKEVHIPTPQRNIMKRNLFSFLDEEVVNE